MTDFPPYTPPTVPNAPADGSESTLDDGLTFPGTVIVRYGNGGSVRHYFGTRDEYTIWADEHTPEQHAQVLVIEQA